MDYPSDKPVRFKYFNKLVIFESYETRFADAQNQSLAAGFFEGIFESFRPASYSQPTPSTSINDS
jgi:hypothetical protein